MINVIQRDPDISDPQIQNALYELVADFGEVYAYALRRDCHLVRAVERPEYWLMITAEIGEARARQLRDGALPTDAELSHLIRWQVDHALARNDDNVVTTLWFCQRHDDGAIIAIEGWGNTIDTKLKFKWIGQYPNRDTAIADLKNFYVTSFSDLDL